MAGRMSLDERARIGAHGSAGTGVAGIAVLVGRDRSTVCRELVRGSCADGSYRAGEAQARAVLRARRPRTLKLGGGLGLAAAVRYRLRHRWAPHSISADLAAEGRRVCAETIYRAAYSGCGLGDDAWRDLPRQRRRRKPRGRHAQKRGPLGDYRPISERRAAVEDRSEPGRWEGDLIVGQANASAAATLAERTSRHALVVPLPDGCRAPQVAEAVAAALGRQPGGLVRTLTWDQGREMARWADIEAALGIEVFFCEPRSPWQRPTNEQTNGLLRRWLPKAPASTSDNCGSRSSRTTSTTCPADSTTGHQHTTSTLNSLATTDRACRSLCPRAGGARGATEAELLAASFVPSSACGTGDAEAVAAELLETSAGVASVDSVPGSGSGPKRWVVETRKTLGMLTRAEKQAVSQADHDKAITDRAFAVASSGPFKKVLYVGGGVLSDPSREPSTTDHGPGSGGGEEQPADNDPPEELQSEGPVGPVGVTGAATYEAVWVPGEFVPTAVEVLSDGPDVELVELETEDRSAFAALLVIDSPEAATEYRFENAVPDGRTAELLEDGSVRFYDLDGNESGGIGAPWALDANGAEVPTSYELDGTTLVQTVDHEGAAYPVIADPVWFVAVVLAVRILAPTAAAVMSRCGPAQCVAVARATGGAVYNHVRPSGGSSSGGRPGNSSSCNARNRTGC